MYAESTVIYSDILFLVNFSLDFLCLFLTGELLNSPAKTKRIVLGSILGGVYSFLPFLHPLPVFYSLPLNFLAAGFITFITFGKKTWKKFLCTVGTFMVTSALMGGLISGIYNLTGSFHNGVYRESDGLVFALICFLSAGIALSYGLICRKRIHIKSVGVRIHTEKEKIELRLLADSGN